MKPNKKIISISILAIMLFSIIIYSSSKSIEKTDYIQSIINSANPSVISSNGSSEPLALDSNNSSSTEIISSVYSSASQELSSISSSSVAQKYAKQSYTKSPDTVTSKYNATLDNVRGVWVTTGWNIDFPSDNWYSKDKLIAELDAIIAKCKKYNLNTIFFQVRPESDALYNSSVFPTSRFLVEKQGMPLKDGFDPLSYIISAAHTNDIALHAWINPYRASVTNSSSLSETHPLKKNPTLWLPTKCKGSDGCFDMNCENQKQLFYDPASPEVRELVLAGVMELVQNYDIDGIHLDDYFYPDAQEYPYNDSETFAKYGNGKSIDDFRRNNTYTLIKLINDNIKSIRQDVFFGVSPAGIWADKSSNPNGSDTINSFQTYSNIFADTRLWVKDRILDYIAPQIYFSGDNARASFDILAKWWNDTVADTGVSLLIGQATYKTEDGYTNGFPVSEIGRQLRLCKTLPYYNGSIQFTYKDLDRISGELIYN